MNISTKIKLLSSALCFFVTTQVNFAVAAEVAGKTMVARGEVKATSSDGSNLRPLKRRSEVFKNDVVITGAGSKTQLRMTDGGMIALKENSELIISNYELNANGDKGSVVLDLVQGGLRSITGAIKADKGDYQLKTAIASIGIRGTHYEIEIVNGVLWLAVWDGAIDVTVDIGINAGGILSLGAGEDFSYGSIDPNGNLNTFIEPPKVFEQGLSSNPKEQANIIAKQQVKQPVNKELSQENQPLKVSQLFNDLEQQQQSVIVHDEIQSQGEQSLRDLVAAREGTMSYSEATFTSSSNLSNFSAGLDINFDSGEISNGQLSFNDDKNSDKWNAVFNGNVNITQDNVFLEVGVTSASHGNNVAEGDISAQFVDSLGLGSVTGNFELYEVKRDVSVNGSYQIKSQ
jgi:hypothetical protein